MVQALSCSPLKGSIHDAVPVCMRPTNCTVGGAGSPACTGVGRLGGVGPFSALGEDRSPLPLRTTRVPLTGARTAVGYQPVGMKPSTRLPPSPTSTTAAALPSEQATKRRLPSALRPSAEGVMPMGWRGVMAMLMLSTRLTSLAAVTPSANTLLVLAAATKMRAV